MLFSWKVGETLLSPFHPVDEQRRDGILNNLKFHNELGWLIGWLVGWLIDWLVG